MFLVAYVTAAAVDKNSKSSNLDQSNFLKNQCSTVVTKVPLKSGGGWSMGRLGKTLMRASLIGFLATVGAATGPGKKGIAAECKVESASDMAFHKYVCPTLSHDANWKLPRLKRENHEFCAGGLEKQEVCKAQNTVGNCVTEPGYCMDNDPTNLRLEDMKLRVKNLKEFIKLSSSSSDVCDLHIEIAFEALQDIERINEGLQNVNDREFLNVGEVMVCVRLWQKLFHRFAQVRLMGEEQQFQTPRIRLCLFYFYEWGIILENSIVSMGDYFAKFASIADHLKEILDHYLKVQTVYEGSDSSDKTKIGRKQTATKGNQPSNNSSISKRER